MVGRLGSRRGGRGEGLDRRDPLDVDPRLPSTEEAVELGVVLDASPVGALVATQGLAARLADGVDQARSTNPRTGG